MSNDIPFYNLTRVVRGGWFVIVATTLVLGLFGFVGWVLAPTSYSSTATLQVTSTGDVSETNMQTEQTIAQSTGVLRAARRDLTGWTLTSLRDALSVTVTKDADVLEVTVSDDSGMRAADAANAVADAYLKDRSEANDQRQQQSLKLLSAQITQLNDQIRVTTDLARKGVLESRLAALTAQYAVVKANAQEPGRVLSGAEVPDSSSTPGLLVWVAAGLVAGALLGFYLATVTYRLRRARGGQ